MQTARPRPRSLRLPSILVALLVPGLAGAGAHDYYECIGPDGGATYSIERCAKGEKQRRIQDDTPPGSQSLGAATGGTVRLDSSRGSHFYATVNINGIPVRGMVDTGASSVSISPAAARRLGLDLQKGVPTQAYTANGVAQATGVVFSSVELGGNTVRNVRGLVTSKELGPDAEALIGMAFLKHFEVNTDGYRMTLRPK